MSLETRVITKYRGLNLSSGGLGVGMEFATDSINMDYNTLGALQSRGGWFQMSSVGQAAGIRHLLYRPQTDRIVTIGAGEVNQYAHTTGVKSVPAGVPTWLASTASPPALFGLPTGERYIYMPGTNFGSGVQYHRMEDNPLANTVTVGILAAKPQFMAVYPGQNRMAYGGFYTAADAPGGANGSPSTVFFSDEQAPEVVDATNFVVLEPGDGGSLAGMVGWQNQLFVFKNKTIYVFYGVSPDDDGKPIFNYKTWPLPDPIPETGGNPGIVPIAAGPDGVYFMGSQGLWKTTGAQPTRIATPIDAFFSGEPGPSGVGGLYRQFVRGNVTMGWVGDRLFINYNSVSPFGPRTMVWNKTFDAWTTWEITTDVMSAIPITVNDGIFGAGVSNSNSHLWKQIPLSSFDAGGNPVLWKYTTGFDDFGFTGEKRLRYIDVYGQGPIGPTVYAKGRRTSGVGSAAALNTVVGSTNVTDRKRFSIPLKGRHFQLYFDNAAQTGRSVIERVEIRYAGGSPV